MVEIHYRVPIETIVILPLGKLKIEIEDRPIHDTRRITNWENRVRQS